MNPHQILLAMNLPENRLLPPSPRRKNYSERADNIILMEWVIGFLPPIAKEDEEVVDAINRYRKSEMTADEFDNYINIKAILTRNATIELLSPDGTRNYELEEGQKDYLQYNLPEAWEAWKKDAVRKRLTILLGYEPELKYSFGAEMFMRRFSSDLEKQPNNIDYRAISMVKFREVLLTQGLEAARNSPIAVERWRWIKPLVAG